MRIAVCALSAVLLSGCSWLGLGGSSHHGGKYAANSHYGAQQGGHYKGQAKRHDPCQIMSPAQPIPRGCAPHQVTVAASGAQGGFAQKPDFGSGQYASAGYGSHAANAGQHNAHAKRGPRLRKPRLRGQASMGFEKSNSGEYLDFNKFGAIDSGYVASDYNQSLETGTVGSGSITTTTWTVDDATVEVISPNISNDDVHSTPFRVAGGLEYILAPKTTVFANAGYSTAEGKSIGGVSYVGDIRQRRSVQTVNPGTGANIGAPVNTDLGVRDQELALITYDFSDMRRVDLELGARHYFNPIMKNHLARAVTPFVGASAGASHYNRQTVGIDGSQLLYNTAFTGTDQYYDITLPGGQTEVYGSQWVPSGSLTTGLEWQMTPKTAMAFETGVRVEGGRDYSNGEKTDTNIAIPFTIRGSYNF